MKLRVLSEDTNQEAKALSDYVYGEAKIAGEKASPRYTRPFTAEDLHDAYLDYTASESFSSWMENVVGKQIHNISYVADEDMQGLFEGGQYDTQTAIKDGFTAGFGGRNE